MDAMGQDLTKRYAALFDKRRAGNLLHFGRDVYRSGKLREITSFAIWELFHKLNLFSKSDYVKFNNTDVVTLGDDLNSAEFQAKLDGFFQSQGLFPERGQHNWKLLTINGRGDHYGCLYPDDCELYRSVDGGRSVRRVYKFPEKIKALFISSRNTLFVCIKGAVYRSSDEGATFVRTLELGTSESFFRHNNAMTEASDQTLVIGEYGNVWESSGWHNLANLYFSGDDGNTWTRSEFLKHQGTNKHVHLTWYSPLLKRLLVADGDNLKKLWVSNASTAFRLERLTWTPITRHHIQMGGYTALAETADRIIFGTDYQGGTNFVVTTKDGQTYTRQVMPDPYRRSPIDNMVQRQSRYGTEIWANLPYSSSGTKCLLMYSRDSGQSWTRVFEYSRSSHVVWLLSSSSWAIKDLYFSIDDLRSNVRVVYRVSDSGSTTANSASESQG